MHDETGLGDRERAAYEALVRIDPTLGKLYRAALAIADDARVPDHLALAAHELRELIEKLARTVGVPWQAMSESLHAKAAELVEAYRVYSSKPIRSDNEKDKLIGQLKSFAGWFSQHRPRRRAEVARVLAALNGHVGIEVPFNVLMNTEQVMNLWDFFSKVSHHDTEPTEDGFRERLRELESILLPLLHPETFDDFNAVDAVIHEGENNAITNALVERAVSLVRRRPLNYKYFFDNLPSPDWIRPLRQNRLFDHPPQPREEDNGISHPPWPASGYLARVAADAPDQVIDLILDIARKTTNVSVHEDCAAAATVLPLSHAMNWAKTEIEWLKGRRHLPFRFPESIMQLAVRFAKEGKTDDCLTLMKALLSPLPEPPEGTEPALHLEPETLLDPWAYEELVSKHVPTVVYHAGVKAFTVLCDLLASASKLVEHPNDEGEWILHDSSYIWRPAIEDHDQNLAHGVRTLLVSAVRDAAELLVSRDPESLQLVVSQLQNRRWCIFHRIALHLLCRFGQGTPDLLARHLTDRALFNCQGLIHEYVLLAKDRFGELRFEDQATILGWIEAGPDLAAHEEWLGRPASREERERYVKHWQRDRLAPLADSGSLPPCWQHAYDRLVAELGRPEHPELLSWSETWVGPTSPKSPDELGSMSTQELVSYLGTWSAPRQWHGPTPEGLGRAVTAVVKVEAARFARDAHIFKGLDPTYVRAVLSGLWEAVREGSEIDWSPVLDLCKWVVQQPRDESERTHGYEERDRGWGWTRGEIADLLSAGLGGARGVGARGSEIPFSLRQAVWDILRPLTDDPDPTEPAEACSETSSASDPLTRSLHTTRGKAMHAVIHFALWVRRNLLARLQNSSGRAERRSWLSEMPEVEETLGAHLDPGVERAPAIRAVYGQWFPQLVMVDKRWAATNASRIFPSGQSQRRLWDAAWRAYVMYNPPRPDVAGLLLSQYRLAAERISQSRRKGVFDSPVAEHDERLAEHLMELHWTGHPEFDQSGILDLFYKEAPAALRGHAMAYVGRRLHRIEGEVPSEAKQRLENLLDRRLKAKPSDEELTEYGWWFTSGKFGDVWAVAKLKDVLGITKWAEPDHLIVKRLAELAPTMPGEVIECLQLMLVQPKDGWSIRAWEDDARRLLRMAMKADDKAVRDRAEDVVHRLGALGLLEFRDLVPPKSPEG